MSQKRIDDGTEGSSLKVQSCNHRGHYDSTYQDVTDLSVFLLGLEDTELCVRVIVLLHVLSPRWAGLVWLRKNTHVIMSVTEE